MARFKTLTPEQRTARIKERHREWQRRNPDKVRQYMERYIIRKAAKLQEAKRHETDERPKE